MAERKASTRQFKLPPLRRRLLGGGLWALGGQAILLSMVVAKSAILTRILAPNQVGAYFLAVTLVTVGAMLAVMGLEKGVLQQVAESLAHGWHNRVRGVILRAFLLGVAGATVVGGAFVIGLGPWLVEHVFGSDPLRGVIGLVGAWLFLLSVEKLLGETFRGLHDIREATVFGGTLTAVLTVGFFAAVWVLSLEANLETVVVLTVVAVGANVIVGAAGLRGRLLDLTGDNDGSKGTAPDEGVTSTMVGATATVGSLLLISFPLLLSNVATYAMGQSGLWIIAGYLPEEDVALYGSASQVAALVGVSLVIANKVLPPIIGEYLASDDRSSLEELLRISAGLAFVPALVVFLCITLAGQQILALIFGDFYAAGAGVLALLAFGQIASVAVGSCGFVLIMSGHQRDLMWITLASVLIAVVAAVGLVRPYGIVGVAGATAGARIVQELLMLIRARATIGVWTHVSIIRLPTVVAASIRMWWSNRDKKRKQS